MEEYFELLEVIEDIIQPGDVPEFLADMFDIEVEEALDVYYIWCTG